MKKYIINLNELTIYKSLDFYRPLNKNVIGILIQDYYLYLNKLYYCDFYSSFNRYNIYNKNRVFLLDNIKNNINIIFINKIKIKLIKQKKNKWKLQWLKQLLT